MRFSETANKVINILIDNGFEGYLVGGSVRDLLMGKPTGDIDVTTNATPCQMQSVFSGYKVIETGIKHGTLTVLFDGEPIEITTYRTESGYSDNRHPDSVKFVKNLSEDLKRRDFTINAIAYNEKEGVIDLFGGKSDIENKIIKTVGCPDERFNEDALRILRAIRFSSTLSFEIEGKTKKSILKNKGLLNKISAERIFSELKKLIVGDNINYVLVDFKEVFISLFPLLSKGYDEVVSIINNSPKDVVLRLAILFSNLTKFEAITVLKALKSDNQTIKIVSVLIQNKEIEILQSKTEIKRILQRVDSQSFKYLIEFKKAFSCDKDYYDNIYKMYIDIINGKECYLVKHLKINGDNLKKLGYTGKQIKDELNRLLDDVITERLENKKEDLIKKAKNDGAIN